MPRALISVVATGGNERVSGRARGRRGEPVDHAAGILGRDLFPGHARRRRGGGRARRGDDGCRRLLRRRRLGRQSGRLRGGEAGVAAGDPDVVVPGQLARQRFVAQGVSARRLAGRPSQDFIDAPGKARWYKFSVTPGQRIEVVLTGPAGRLRPGGVQGHRPGVPGPVQSGDRGAERSAQADRRVRAVDVQPVAFSPSTFSPSTFSPDAYSPSTFSPSMFSPTRSQPVDVQPVDVQPVDVQPVDVLAVDVQPVDVQPVDVLAVGVHRRPRSRRRSRPRRRAASSACRPRRAPATRSSVVNTWNNTGNFYVRVTGRGGAFDTSSPFTVTVTKGATTCTGVTDTALTPRAAVARIGTEDGDPHRFVAGCARRRAARARRRDAARQARRVCRAQPTSRASWSTSPATRGWARSSSRRRTTRPARSRRTSSPRRSRASSTRYRANPLQYVVIVGNDDAIPFFRSPDQSGLGQESGYVPPVQSNSTSEASLRLDFVLSQDAYGAKTEHLAAGERLSGAGAGGRPPGRDARPRSPG